MRRVVCASVLLSFVAGSCSLSDRPEGLAAAEPAATTVRMDFEHKPLPEIPLPNDIATRYDATSATKRRINASQIAPTRLESDIRERLDQLDGWGHLQPITIPFTGPLGVQSIIDAHRDADYDTSDDVIYLIDIDRDSPKFGELQLLDFGNGNYPPGTEKRNEYWQNDPRVETLSLLFEETDEDLNGNGIMDPGEDTDGDGVLDEPNYYPGADPDEDDLAARADALMSFYEKETHTLIAMPLVPLRERTTYAVVVTRRLEDERGEPVGSPYPWINHTGQTRALQPLAEVLPHGLGLDDVAFAFTFTTQTTMAEWAAVRDGLYGHGVQKHLAADFPPVLHSLEQLKDAERFESNRPYVLFAEEFAEAFQLINQAFRGAEGDSFALEVLTDSYEYLDYIVMGSFVSPQLYDRHDDDGNLLRWDAQSWPIDLDRAPAAARGERVYFTLTVPRKEVSARGNGEPAPVAIFSHGHTGNRFDALNFGPYFARHGVAMLAFDGPGHGLNIGKEDEALAGALLDGLGLGEFFDAANLGRAFDQNFDGQRDSGADFWTFYLFHTRDNVRQMALDYMQLVRVLRGFDGQRRWDMDVDGDGENELAGDFNADGVVDVGGSAPITMSGGSLGGIMSMLMAGLEPELDAVAPLVGGGGLGIIARRSTNTSVRRQIMLRTFGPLFIGTPDEDGKTRIETLVPNINKGPLVAHIETVEGVEPGDTMALENLVNGERECGKVDAQGHVRTPLPSDLGDRVRISLYRGDVQTGEDCKLAEDATPYHVIEEFATEGTALDQQWAAGAPLYALSEGLGLRRASPDLRRMVGLGQLVMDRADPAIYARNTLLEPFTYPGTGQTTGAHILMTTGIGDINVPVDAGMTFARAAGILEYRKANPDYGVPDNQVLIDHHVPEGLDEYKRYVNSAGVGVLADPNDFSGDTDYWAGEVERLDPPLRPGLEETDLLGGYSASVYAYGSNRGKHGFDPPGEMVDDARKRCRNQCAEGDECGCDELVIFDVGNFHFNMMADYLKHSGKSVSTDLCHSRSDCPEIMPAPEARTPDVLRSRNP